VQKPFSEWQGLAKANERTQSFCASIPDKAARRKATGDRFHQDQRGMASDWLKSFLILLKAN
jgi:hypothetical protein